MKSFYRFFTMLLLIGTHAVFGQCPSGNVTLNSQAEVNAFAANYPDCTEIPGSVIIWGTDIVNLDPLSNITSIGGYLRFYNNPVLQTFEGLNNLTSIGGSLYIDSYNFQLQNLDGLDNLTNIGGSLYFKENNSQLQNIDGLSNLTNIGGSLEITFTSQLQNLDGLNNLTNIGSYLRIDNNEQLENLEGLSNLTNIGNDLFIESNDQLEDISGLANIDPATIGGVDGLFIWNNSLLQVCNLPNFCTYLTYPADTHPRSIGGNAGNCINVAAVELACEAACTITDDIVLTSQADVVNFSSAYMYCSDITVNNLVLGYATGSTMSDINDLSPLQSITAVTGDLIIGNNPNLLTLNGLQNITSVGGNLGLN